MWTKICHVYLNILWGHVKFAKNVSWKVFLAPNFVIYEHDTNNVGYSCNDFVSIFLIFLTFQNVLKTF